MKKYTMIKSQSDIWAERYDLEYISTYYSSNKTTPKIGHTKFNPEFICCYCEIALTPNSFSREHVIPKSKGGSNDKNNIRPCCKTCNSEKGNMTLPVFIYHLNCLQSTYRPNTEMFDLLSTKIKNANKLAKEISGSQQAAF